MGRRRNEQVDVVRHQHVRVHRALVPARGGAKEFQVEMPIAIGPETIAAIVSALDDVERDARKI